MDDIKKLFPIGSEFTIQISSGDLYEKSWFAPFKRLVERGVIFKIIPSINKYGNVHCMISEKSIHLLDLEPKILEYRVENAIIALDINTVLKYALRIQANKIKLSELV